jgi:hypothetical protein
MITKHTPGPWKVIETNYLPHNGDHVADMSNGLMVVPCLSGLGEPLADARLIAAAPDLLEALTRLSFAAMARDNVMGDQCALFAAQAAVRDANNVARAAIAKATGAA